MDKSILFSKSFDLAVAAAKLDNTQVELRQEQLYIAWAEALRETAVNIYLSTAISGSQQTFSIRLYTARKFCLRARLFTDLLKNADIFAEETAGIYEQELLEILKMLQSSLNTLREKQSGDKKSSKSTPKKEK